MRRHCIRSQCVSPLFSSFCVIPLASCLFLPSFPRSASRQSNIVSVQFLSTELCTQSEASDDEDETEVIYPG
ncbi:hypothetical protein F5888DRAFT_1732990 [Russula emetica]|nr:hypothetical protein F5888DRAFT_1732990 [Russula emetica]